MPALRPVVVAFCFLFSFTASAQITAYGTTEGLPSNDVTALYRDNDAYLWCGTSRGVAVFDGWEFHHPQTTSEKSAPALNKTVHSIVGSYDHQTVWIGTDSIIMQMDRYSLKLLRTFDVSKKTGSVEIPIVANDTAVWLSCSGMGLYRVRISDGKTTALSASGAYAGTQALINKNYLCIADSNQQLVFSDITSSRIWTIALPDAVQPEHINEIVEFPGVPQAVLLLTEHGMWQCNYSTGVVERYFLNATKSDTLSAYRSMCVHPDSTWWFARDNDICVFDPGEHKLIVQGDGDTILIRRIHPVQLITDNYGVIWCATEKEGLWKMLHGVAYRCLGTPRVVMTYADSADGSGIIRESIVRVYGDEPISLKLWQTDFAFPERARFEYQLEGFDGAEIIAEGQVTIRYEDLASGFYSLLCSVTTPGCASSSTMKLGTIKIVPPFWMSRWFIGITSMGVVLIITLVLFVMMRLRYQRKIRKLKMQQELDKVRQRISRDIHDEIGAGLTRIALSGELMAQKVSAQDASHEKLKWIAGTARELSQNMKEVVWSVNPHYDSLDHMTAYFRSYVAGIAEEGEVRFIYSGDESFPPIEVNPETRRNLLLILKEAVSNAIKYSGCTQLSLEVHWKNQQIHILVADNGKGFELHSSSGVNSNGLRNIRQRAEASGCTAEITSSPGKGTSVRITGPINHNETPLTRK